ncbi:MAG: multiple sugar transport system ATP-binding protein [Gaiellales bacterium]|nr:multiple sugar transport system ATP-binding protein [Gaiellales bacterium]
MARIVLDEVTKIFGSDVVAVNNVTLEVGDGEFMVLVGPSGCGKSTLLRIVAGLEELTAGEVVIGDTIVTDMQPRDRDIAMVFQNYALYPHMSVEQNLGIGLKLRHVPKAERRQKVLDVARTLGLDKLLDRKPAALSGGQRQRVAMGRAMVREPRAFLMDEPLSNLDAKLRVQMRAELARLRDTLKTTTLYVTHDQVEAMTLGDRVAVMNDGVVQQLDTPQRLYRSPANLFVAAFIGSPSMNLIDAQVTDDELWFAEHRLPLPVDRNLREYRGQRIVLGLRPADFEDAAHARDDGQPTLEVAVDVVEELGSEINILFRIDAPAVITPQTQAVAEAVEADVSHVVPLVGTAEQTICTARVSARSDAQAGERVRLAVAPDRMHFFDRETGDVIAAGAASAAPTTAQLP